MVDGSELPYEQNVAFTQRVMKAAGARGMGVEAELGRLSGSEDGETVAEYEAHLTDVKEVGGGVGGCVGLGVRYSLYRDRDSVYNVAENMMLKGGSAGRRVPCGERGEMFGGLCRQCARAVPTGGTQH